MRQENNIAHRIHKIHRMSSSAWSESETNRNSVCSVLSVCKQIRADPRDSPEINNQHDFTDETIAMRSAFYSCDPCDWLARPSVRVQKKEKQMYCVLTRISQWTFKKWSLYFCCLNTNSTDCTNIICEILRFAWGIVSTDHEDHEEKQFNPCNLLIQKIFAWHKNNIAHRIHKIHRTSSSARSESAANRNSVYSVLSVCKHLRADTRNTLETNNQRDFTDETVPQRFYHLTGTDVRRVRPQFIGRFRLKVRLMKDARSVRPYLPIIHSYC